LLDALAKMTNEPVPVKSTMAEITGSPAHIFREWTIDHADDFRMEPAGRGAGPLPDIRLPHVGASMVSE